MAKDFIPKTDGELSIFLGTFKAQLTALGAGLGFTALEVTDGEDACDATTTKIAGAATKKNESKQANADKESSKKTTINLIRSYARRMKTHPTYTTGKGQLLHIIGEEDAEQDKPLITGQVVPTGVEIGFTKFQFDGVNVYRKRGNQTEYEMLAFDKVSPYIDNEALLVAGQPEKRDYYVVGVVDDVEVGDPSDIVSVV